MKLTVDIPKASSLEIYKHAHRYDVDGFERPYGRWIELKRNSESMTIEFDVDRHDVLSDYYWAITRENVHQVWAEIRQNFIARPWRGYESIPRTCLEMLRGIDPSFDRTFVVLRQQKGLGFMGGVGCGTKIHHLTYDVLKDIQPELQGIEREAAGAWYNMMLGQRKYLRQEKKVIRDLIKEEDLVIAINAHPRCQRTVAFQTAHGFPLRAKANAPISCAKCAKIKVD